MRQEENGISTKFHNENKDSFLVILFDKSTNLFHSKHLLAAFKGFTTRFSGKARDKVSGDFNYSKMRSYKLSQTRRSTKSEENTSLYISR